VSSFKLFLYGLASEQSAFLVIFGVQPFGQKLGLFLSAHALASALFSSLLAYTLSKRFSSVRIRINWLFFAFNFFIPFLGALGSLIVLIYFLKYVKPHNRPEFDRVSLPPFLFEAAEPGAGMGEGGAWSRLRAAGLSRNQKLQALLAVGTAGGGNAGRLLQHATTDDDDEIRLLAFNLYERQEEKIQQGISLGLDALKQATSPDERSVICRNLAFAYWEMVYSALVLHDLLDFFLDKATWYAELALENSSEHPALLVLIARIHLYRHNYDAAQEALQAAQDAGVDQSKVIPYQAELAFVMRDFKELRRLLAMDEGSQLRPGIGPVASFWGVH